VVDNVVSKEHLQLSDKDGEYLKGLLSKGQLQARVFRRANGLLQLQQGKTLIEVAANLGVARVTAARWRDAYKKQGLKCLVEAPRPGRPVKIDGSQRAKITALACSQAPVGHARWSLRLLAEKIVELGYCREISHQQVKNILKKTNSSRTSRKRGVSGSSMPPF
jgi:transposase